MFKVVPVNDKYDTCGYNVSNFLLNVAYTISPPPIALPAAWELDCMLYVSTPELLTWNSVLFKIDAVTPPISLAVL